MQKLLTGAVAAFGLAYASLWWSFERFYTPFHVSPEDVGLGPTGASAGLAGAALQLGIWLVIVLTLLALLPTLAVRELEKLAVASAKTTPQANQERVMIVRAVRNAYDSVKETVRLTPERRKISRAAIFGAAGGALYFLLAGVQGVGTILVAGAVYWVLRRGVTKMSTPKNDDRAREMSGPAVAGTREGIDVKNNMSEEQRPPVDVVTRGVDQFRNQSVLSLALVTFFTAAVIGIALLDLPNDAYEAARCAASGKKAVPALNLGIPLVHLPILGVHAQPGTLTWLTKPPPGTKNDDPIVYLGQAGGSIVAYEVARKVTGRFPATQVVVSINAQAKNCPQVH